GVGVIFYLMMALRSELRCRAWFESQGLKEPNLAQFLDLVALGTVADVVPLDRNNRVLVAAGLKRIRAGRARVGIVALLEMASRDPLSTVASDLGFAVAPRLNAAGRLDDMSIGIECLMCDEKSTAASYALQLDRLNKDRRIIENEMQQDALVALKGLQFEDTEPLPVALTLYQPDWHQGVIGILASRVKDRIHRPVIAFANGSDNQIKGSARSIAGIHIRDMLDAVATRHPGLISKFGGHAMAAGLSLAQADYADFSSAFVEEVGRHVEAGDMEAVIYTDGELEDRDYDLQVANELRFGGPWGQHFPEPLFDGRFTLVQQRLVGEKHLKLTVTPVNSTRLIDAIAFNVDLDRWPDESVEIVNLAYRLDINEFRGNTNLQLVVEYLSADGH
ncbi:MAG: single-stranded-DNA-specific exonuclease RecJ, partial [Halieaceae bacterium]|nr:single-stranded-DNA-specific exonuclease RecJ [Halieaceae bacterium]